MAYECDDVNEWEVCDTLFRHREAICSIKV